MLFVRMVVRVMVVKVMMRVLVESILRRKKTGYFDTISIIGLKMKEYNVDTVLQTKLNYTSDRWVACHHESVI